MSSGGWGIIDPAKLDEFFEWLEGMETFYAPLRDYPQPEPSNKEA